MARLLAREGCHVWLVARQQDKLVAALSDVNAARRDDKQICGSISADVSDPEQAFAAVEQVINEVGVPHLLINSAGVACPGYFYEQSLDAFHQMMDVNYFGTVYMAKAVLSGMIARGAGHIVNISSVAGFLGVFGYSAYGASKFAVSGFSDILRAELKPHGIYVSVVFPSDVDTPQLAYESQFRPVETRILCDDLPIQSAEKVATAILHGVSRRRYVIAPSAVSNTLYWLINTIRNVANPVMDWMVVLGKRKMGKNG